MKEDQICVFCVFLLNLPNEDSSLVFFILNFRRKHMKTNRTLFFVIIANLTALSVLFYFFPKVPLPFIFPSFLELQLSNLPAIIGGFALGPVAGAIIIVARTIIKLPFSTTAYVGEFVDLIIGVSTVVASSLIYKKIHTKKGALYAALVGMVVWTTIALLANYFFILDLYIEIYFDGDLSALLGFLQIIPGINETNYMGKYILYAILPFNLLLSGIVYGITFVVYKRISGLIETLNDRFQK
jgi:riboflavin transporter FmnP